MRRTWGVLGLLFAISGVASADPLVGARWMPFQLVSKSGELASSAPGRVTVFTICAYWCDTWKVELPRLAKARQELAGLPVDIVTITVDGRWSDLANSDESIPVWLDRGGDWSKRQGIERVPTTVVLTPSGEVSYVSGVVNRSQDIVAAVHQALNGPAISGNVFLTFGNFPPPIGGDALLDCLRTNGVQATFFCRGDRIAASAKLLKRALADGHSLQIERWSEDVNMPNLERCQRVFRKTLGYVPLFSRVESDQPIVGESNHHRMVDPYDETRPSSKEIMRRVIAPLCPGAVICLHADVRITQESLPDIILGVRRRGFSFALLSHTEKSNL